MPIEPTIPRTLLCKIIFSAIYTITDMPRNIMKYMSYYRTDDRLPLGHTPIPNINYSQDNYS